jgi:type I restriction enzyme R subunit
LQDVAQQLTHLLKAFYTVGHFAVLHRLRHQQQKEKNKSGLSLSAIRRSQRHCRTGKRRKIKKGLIWHFQGSGKSLLMLFAAQKLRKQQDLHNPTVMIVVDRVDLDTQITATFNTAEVPNMITTDSIKELHKLLEQDTRKIIITMVHKFKDAYPDMNKRENIIVMVDEAHRTQEGDLGRKMRNALPNAFLFGLTGTP